MNLEISTTNVPLAGRSHAMEILSHLSNEASDVDFLRSFPRAKHLSNGCSGGINIAHRKVYAKVQIEYRDSKVYSKDTM